MITYDNRIDDILKRNIIKNDIKEILKNNELKHTNKECIFISGKSGIGKTAFVLNILRELNYDTIRYDASDIRNKNIVETIISNSISTVNVCELFSNNRKKNIIVMDEIEGMNNGDRGGINTLIKLIRPKQVKTSKTKKVLEDKCSLICICNHNTDKKLSEIMKLCRIIYLDTPTHEQLVSISKWYLPAYYSAIPEFADDFVKNCKHDLRKFFIHVKTVSYCESYQIHLSKQTTTYSKHKINFTHQKQTISNQNIQETQSAKDNHKDKDKEMEMTEKMILNLLKANNFNLKVKIVVQHILQFHSEIYNTEIFTNENNRTIISLLWHENIIDYLNSSDTDEFIRIYQIFLKNICFGDYIDRITFQKQIWQLNEMTSYIKIMYNYLLIKSHINSEKTKTIKTQDIRFTKVLTKYSSEYNNYIFLQSICQIFSIEKKNLFSMLQALFLKYNNNFTRIFQELSSFKISICLLYTSPSPRDS